MKHYLSLFSIIIFLSGCASSSKPSDNMVQIKSTATVSATPSSDTALIKAVQGLTSKNRNVIVNSFSYIVTHADETSSVFMFLAAGRAFKLQYIEDAGFLFYAGQMRSNIDLQRFPPTGKGGNSPNVALDAIKQTLGSVINPMVFRLPDVYSKIIDRLELWEPVTKQNYDPGWKHKGRNDKYNEHKVIKNIKSEYLNHARGISKLLHTPEYFEAFKVVQDYNFGEGEFRKDIDNKNAKEKAEATLQDIEEKLNIHGFYFISK